MSGESSIKSTAPITGDTHFLNKRLLHYAMEIRGGILRCLSILNCSYYFVVYVTGTQKLYIIELPSGLEYMNNFLFAYGIYNPPVTIETRVK